MVNNRWLNIWWIWHTKVETLQGPVSIRRFNQFKTWTLSWLTLRWETLSLARAPWLWEAMINGALILWFTMATAPAKKTSAYFRFNTSLILVTIVISQVKTGRTVGYGTNRLFIFMVSHGQKNIENNNNNLSAFFLFYKWSANRVRKIWQWLFTLSGINIAYFLSNRSFLQQAKCK